VQILVEKWNEMKEEKIIKYNRASIVRTQCPHLSVETLLIMIVCRFLEQHIEAMVVPVSSHRI